MIVALDLWLVEYQEITKYVRNTPLSARVQFRISCSIKIGEDQRNPANYHVNPGVKISGS
jgi:hypothetical protein